MHACILLNTLVFTCVYPLSITSYNHDAIVNRHLHSWRGITIFLIPPPLPLSSLQQSETNVPHFSVGNSVSILASVALICYHFLYHHPGWFRRLRREQFHLKRHFITAKNWTHGHPLPGCQRDSCVRSSVPNPLPRDRNCFCLGKKCLTAPAAKSLHLPPASNHPIHTQQWRGFNRSKSH